MECPRCTSDLDRQTDWIWTCPACGLELDVPIITSPAQPEPERARELRDAWSEVAEIMVELAEEYPHMKHLFTNTYQFAGELAERYDTLAGDA